MVKERSFLRRFWKPILLAALVLALVLTSVGLNSSSREAKSLREQVERQNELIAALNDEREAAKDKEINVVVTSDTIEQQLSSIWSLRSTSTPTRQKRRAASPGCGGWSVPSAARASSSPTTAW